MSKSPVSERTGGATPEFSAEDLPLGVQAAHFLLRNALLIIGLGIAGGSVASIIALLLPRPWVDTAVVEVGMRSANEPLENPIHAGWRLRGALLEAAADLGVPLEATIVHRREEKTNELTRFMDISVSAETASTARTILDRGLGRLTREHRDAHKYEREVFREQLKSLDAMGDHLEERIREAPSKVVAPGDEVTARAELDALNARLFEVVRSAQIVRSLMSDVRTPTTTVVARAPKVEQTRSRTAISLVGGMIFGLLLGVALAGAGTMSQSKGSAS